MLCFILLVVVAMSWTNCLPHNSSNCSAYSGSYRQMYLLFYLIFYLLVHCCLGTVYHVSYKLIHSVSALRPRKYYSAVVF